MPRVWMVTLKTAIAKIKLVTCAEFLVRGRRCVVIDAEPTEVKMKLLWLPERVEDIYIGEAVQSFGRIKTISAETWRVSDLEQMRTLNRGVVVSLADEVCVTDIPHLLTVCGLHSLVLIPGNCNHHYAYVATESGAFVDTAGRRDARIVTGSDTRQENVW